MLNTASYGGIGPEAARCRRLAMAVTRSGWRCIRARANSVCPVALKLEGPGTGLRRLVAGSSGLGRLNSPRLPSSASAAACAWSSVRWPPAIPDHMQVSWNC